VEEKVEEVPSGPVRSEKYDALKREPLYAHADSTPFWELHLLKSHFNPSISLWSNQLIAKQTIEYSGDPLLDFSTANFLDRISFKNPKSKEKLAKAIRVRGADVQEPANKSTSLSKPDEAFYSKYFTEKKQLEPEAIQAEDEEEFANMVIEKEMKNMIGVDPDVDGEESIDMSEDSMGEREESEQEVEGEEEEQSMEMDFFSDEEDMQDLGDPESKKKRD
jgi:ribosome biogenesis protein MAK21